MPNTRKRIQLHLEEVHHSTVKEISRLFDLTPANIRYHLGMMLEDGQVVASKKSGRAGRGRPQYEYRLAPKTQQNSLSDLAVASLNVIAAQDSARKRDAMLNELAEAMADKNGGAPNWSPGRLRIAISHLNDLNYHAHWEARAAGPQVKFRQCPYAQIIDDHPLLCRMDASLLETMLGTKVEQKAKINREEGGAKECVFSVALPQGMVPTR